MRTDLSGQYDVLILGAGASGIGAAIAASRKGARTILIEKYGFLGGLACSAEVGTICGLYTRGSHKTELAGNFANEFRERLERNGSTKMQNNETGLAYLPYEVYAFEDTARTLLKETSLDVLLHATGISISTNHDKASKKIEKINIISGNKTHVISASSFIDASGEAVLSKLAGAKLISSEEYQAPAFVVGINNLSESALSISEKDFNFVLLKELTSAENIGVLEKGTARVSLVPGSLKKRRCKLKLAYPFCRQDSDFEMTLIEDYGRSAALSTFFHLKNNLPLFKDAEIFSLAPQAGIRTGPRGKGLYTLKKAEVLEARKHDKGIANGLWPIEMWGAERKPLLEFFPENDYYQVPADCLISSDISNLFFSGRGISADEYALSSARVIGTSFSTGYASGYLAASSANKEGIDEAIINLRYIEGLS